MMKYNKILPVLFAILTIWASTGCKKFLDVGSPTSNVNPSTIRDFQEMLNSDSLGRCQYFILDAMSDDIQLTDAQAAGISNYYRRAYFYESAVWNPADVDQVYNSTYSRILQMNIILSKVDGAPNDASNTPANKSNVISQALINRAYFYLQLVNAYGPAYDAATAGKDLAVPLALVPDPYALPARATVEQVYAQIIRDLKQAADNPYLPAKGVDIIHPGKAAAFGLLARAYLYKNDYTNARIYADSTLARASTLQNYTNSSYSSPAQLQDLTRNPEILMGKVSADINFYLFYTGAFRSSLGFRGNFPTGDNRYSKRFSFNVFTLSTAIPLGTALVLDNSVGVAESMLIKAECLARAGSVAPAADLLTKLRANRIENPVIPEYTADNILDNVLSERRRELFCHGGLRLFDLKRLNKSDKYKVTIQRTDVAGTTVLTTVAPGSNRYLLPFSQSVLSANPNIVQNSRL